MAPLRDGSCEGSFKGILKGAPKMNPYKEPLEGFLCLFWGSMRVPIKGAALVRDSIQGLGFRVLEGFLVGPS